MNNKDHIEQASLIVGEILEGTLSETVIQVATDTGLINEPAEMTDEDAYVCSDIHTGVAKHLLYLEPLEQNVLVVALESMKEQLTDCDQSPEVKERLEALKYLQEVLIGI